MVLVLGGGCWEGVGEGGEHQSGSEGGSESSRQNAQPESVQRELDSAQKAHPKLIITALEHGSQAFPKQLGPLLCIEEERTQGLSWVSPGIPSP